MRNTKTDLFLTLNSATWTINLDKFHILHSNLLQTRLNLLYNCPLTHLLIQNYYIVQTYLVLDILTNERETSTENGMISYFILTKNRPMKNQERYTVNDTRCTIHGERCTLHDARCTIHGKRTHTIGTMHAHD